MEFVLVVTYCGINLMVKHSFSFSLKSKVNFLTHFLKRINAMFMLGYVNLLVFKLYVYTLSNNAKVLSSSK